MRYKEKKNQELERKINGVNMIFKSLVKTLKLETFCYQTLNKHLLIGV